MPHPMFCYFVVEKSKIRYKYLRAYWSLEDCAELKTTYKTYTIPLSIEKEIKPNNLSVEGKRTRVSLLIFGDRFGKSSRFV